MYIEITNWEGTPLIKWNYPFLDRRRWRHAPDGLANRICRWLSERRIPRNTYIIGFRSESERTMFLLVFGEEIKNFIW